MGKIRIYLDNCCYNRPFDDQIQVRISLETQAKLHIQEMIKNEEIELAVSFVSRYENNENPDMVGGLSITDFFRRAAIYIGADNLDDISGKAGELMKANIKMKDAAHLACAIKAKCNYFLTTDDKLIKRYTENEIIVCNPITFLQIAGDSHA